MTDVGSESPFLELSPRAQKFVETSFALDELLKAQANAAEQQGNAEDFAGSVERARLIIGITEQDAALELISVTQFAEPADRTHRREVIESLRNDPDFGLAEEGAAITEADIQSLLEQLPPYQSYSPEVTAFANDYTEKLGQWVTAITAGDDPIVPVVELTPSITEDTEEVPISDNERQSDKPELTITIYKDRVIQIGEDGQLIPLLRIEKELHRSAAEEIEIANRRLRALQVICAHEPAEGERGLLTGDVWKQYAGSDEKLNSMFHSENIVDFLEPITYDDQPLVVTYKVTPDSKRRHHQNGAFAVNFVESNERSGLQDPRVFELPDGNIFFGHIAKVANLFILGSEENPINQEQYLNANIYTPEEAAALVDGPVLSSSASLLRRTIKGAGLEEILQLKSKRIPGDREMLYWLEYHGDEAIGRELYPFLFTDTQMEGKDDAQARENDETQLNPESRLQDVLESTEEREKSIHECLSVAEWLAEHPGELKSAGFDIAQNALFEPSALIALQNSDTIARDNTPAEIRIRLNDMIDVLTDQAALELVLNKLSVDPEDPRWPLVDFLMAEHPRSKKLNAEELQSAFIELDMDLDYTILENLRQMDSLRELTRKDVEKLGEKWYTVLDRIGNDIRRKTGNDAVDFRHILEKTIERMKEYSPGLYLHLPEQNVLIHTYNDWCNRPNRRIDDSTRARRRAWAEAFRVNVNRAVH